MTAIEKIIEKASALNGTVVLPEGMDARVITAACACVDRKICTPVVLGTAEEIAAAEAKEAAVEEADHVLPLSSLAAISPCAMSASRSSRGASSALSPLRSRAVRRSRSAKAGFFGRSGPWL